MKDTKAHVGFTYRAAEVERYALSALCGAAGLRESWIPEWKQFGLLKKPLDLAAEHEVGYQVIQSYLTGEKLKASTRRRFQGAMRTWWRKQCATAYSDLMGRDDLAYVQHLRQEEQHNLWMEGVCQAYKHCMGAKDLLLLPSDRMRAIQRLQEVTIVHYSHSWQGPYKAALVHGKDQVMRIEFSARDQLHMIDSYAYNAADWSSYMTKAKAAQFRSVLATTVPAEDVRPLHQRKRPVNCIL